VPRWLAEVSLQPGDDCDAPLLGRLAPGHYKRQIGNHSIIQHLQLSRRLEPGRTSDVLARAPFAKARKARKRKAGTADAVRNGEVTDAAFPR
jgi:hypothetical protein